MFESLVDLTIPIHHGMGRLGLSASLELAYSYEQHGWRGTKLEMFAHLGTHVDAPNHFIRGADGIERVPLDRLMGEAVVMDFTHKAPEGRIDVDDVSAYDADIEAGDIAIFRTDWTDRAWNTPDFFSRSPFVTAGVGEWMVDKGVKAGVFDFCEEYAVRCNGFTGEECQYHRAVLQHDVYNIEYVRNLGALGSGRAWIMALPLNLVGSDGAPARVVGGSSG